MKNLLEYNGYHAFIELDPNDKIFVGTVIGINDDLSFHGTSYIEIEEMFHQSIDNYLEVCQQIGKEPDKEYKGSFNVRITPEMHKNADIAAKSQGITLNQYIYNAIEASFGNTEKKETIVYCLPLETMMKQYRSEYKNSDYKGTQRISYKTNKEIVLN